jgi:asparagine synthase (glutamine-hydrolysing)
MAHSIETRVPFLDHLVLECAAGVPDEAKLDPVINKPLLVDAVDDPLVRAAAARKKRSFAFPMDRWMKRSAGSLDEISRAAGCLDRRAVQGLWQDFRGSRLHWSRAWSLVALGSSAG